MEIPLVCMLHAAVSFLYVCTLSHDHDFPAVYSAGSACDWAYMGIDPDLLRAAVSDSDFSDQGLCILRELEEAALLDGCGVLKRFVLIVLPLIKPILTTVAILNVLWVWNDFLLPYLILGKPITIPLSQMYFYGQYNQQWHLIMAGFVVTTIPVILFYIFMQKNIVNGIAAGAIKG